MRIVFMGTPEFATPSLAALLREGHTVVGVFTQPDKPTGRKLQLTAPPVKLFAQQAGIPVFQPETFKNRACEPLLQQLAPECIVVAAYGKILPRHVLSLPPMGCVNVHGSLLPKYRGAAPIQWAIINGETETGVTTMYMAPGVDTGDMILQRSMTIGQYETYGQLHDRMREVGAELLAETLRRIADGTAPREEQNHALATEAPMLDKEAARLDFAKPAAMLSKLICGTNPWPVAHTMIEGKGLRVFEARIGRETELAPGMAIGTPEGIAVACGDRRQLLLTEVQLEGGKRLSAEEYLRGRPISSPVALGPART